MNAFKFCLTAQVRLDQNLNMFNSRPEPKSRQTRALLFQTALRLFREKGFEATTMRDIAAKARTALGAAYYYFPSKEAIVQDYYQSVQDERSLRFSPRCRMTDRAMKETRSRRASPRVGGMMRCCRLHNPFANIRRHDWYWNGSSFCVCGRSTACRGARTGGPIHLEAGRRTCVGANQSS